MTIYNSDEYCKHYNLLKKLKEEIEVKYQDTKIENVDKVTYQSPYIWRNIAKLALQIANEQYWFDQYFKENNDERKLEPKFKDEFMGFIYDSDDMD